MLAQGYPNSFSVNQQTQEVLHNLDNETKKIYTDVNNLMKSDGHAHTGNGNDGAVVVISDNSVTTSKITDGAVTLAKLDPAVKSGSIVQVVNYQTGAVSSGTTLIPFDDTIPQSSEGTQFMSVAITPKSATNKLIIDVILNGTYSVIAVIMVCLFQDSTANALASSWHYDSIGGGPKNIIVRYEMTAGTTSLTTFKVRAGGNNAGTLTFNGTSGNRFLGGALISSITITEVAS